MIHRIYRIWDKAALAVSRTSIRENPSAQAPLHPSSFGLQPCQRASSLITTLLVLVVLSTIVVAFMQSMSVERSVARSLMNKTKAEQAAEAGLAEGLSRLSRLMADNPYHAIGYSNVANPSQIVTTLSGLPSFNSTNSPTAYFLISGTNPASAPTNLSATNSVAINSRSQLSSGWIGSPVTNGGIAFRECRAPWTYVLNDPSKPHQPNPSQSRYNPYIGRYAYWIEDETSKLDFQVAGNNAGAGGGFQRSTNSFLASQVDLGALPITTNGLPISQSDSQKNDALIKFRNSTSNLPPDLRVLGQATNIFPNVAENAKFYLSMGAYANDLAGTGQRRVNINSIVTPGNTPDIVSADLDDIAYVITGNHLFPGLNNSSAKGLFLDQTATNAPMPNFGSRFFSGANTANQTIYMKKVAANIRDYIDTDSQPTVVAADGSIMTTPAPAGWWNLWPPQAIGKEAVPVLQETAWAGVEVSWSGSGTTRTGNLTIDQYFELYNPNTKDYTFPSGSKIQLSNLPSWSAGSFPALEVADFDIDIGGVTVSAGKTTVITTNPGPDPTNLVDSGAAIVRRAPSVPEGKRLFSFRSTTESISSGVIGFKLTGRSSSISDTEARCIITTPQGTVDALPKYGFTGSPPTPWHFRGQNVGDRQRFVYAAGIRGNKENVASDANGRSGDARSLSEQLELQPFNSSRQDNTRFYGSIQGGGPPGTATLGKASSSFIDPTKSQGAAGAWGDYNPALNDTPATAYAVIRDGPMLSIGELGNIYDPYRLSSQSGIAASRGGGRTLKIGQNDDLITGQQRFSPAWQNAAWRLTDILGVSTNLSNSVIDPVSRGKLNINSVARDGGVALGGLLRSFTFLPSPDSDPNLSGKTLSAQEIQALVSSVQSYLTTKGPIMERGELSEISFFAGATNNSNTLGGRTVTTLNDRGREEIFRRLIELITTRSASFSIYSVGEAIQESSNGSIRVLSQAREARAYRLDPVIGPNPRDIVTGYKAQQLYEIP